MRARFSANPVDGGKEDIDMRHIAIGGLALALVVSGGCASTDQARLEPDTAATSTVAAPNPTLVPVPAGTTVVTPPSTTVAPPSTTGAPAPATTAVAPPTTPEP